MLHSDHKRRAGQRFETVVAVFAVAAVGHVLRVNIQLAVAPVPVGHVLRVNIQLAVVPVPVPVAGDEVAVGVAAEDKVFAKSAGTAPV